MKAIIPITFIATLVLAEPPVGDGYAAARSSHDDHHHDHHASDLQRSLSEEYGPPSDSFQSARNAPSDGYEYNAPNARNSNARGQSRFPPATVRVSFNQRFSSAAARKSKNAAARSHSHEHSTPSVRSGISQQYGAPAARSLFEQYGAPASRSLPQEYGAPSVVSARTLSTEYGMPDARSTPSQEYGVPVVAARSNQKPGSFRSAQSSKSHDHDYSSPASRSHSHIDAVSQSYSAPAARSNDISDNYEAPKSSFGARTVPSTTYDAPSSRSSSSHGFSSRNADSVSVDSADSVSETYEAPNQRSLEETYGAPNARSLSQEYDVPSSRSNLMTSAIPSSFAAASSRSSPSSTYLPASRNAAPSDQYGVPEQRDSASQGYEEARARALEELQNQEPASYDFGYQIEDQESGSDFGHTETREADKAQGSYFVVRPDGTKQTVEYEADERGFQPRISVEPADAAARAAGYDGNAQDGSAQQGHY